MSIRLTAAAAVAAEATPPPNPFGSDWVTSFEDFTDNTVITTSPISFGNITLQSLASGTGVTSFHANSKIDTGSFGVRQFTLPSSAGYYNVSTDAEAFKCGVATVRTGARIQYEDLPVSGGENYYHFVGVSSGGTSLPGANYAVIGMRLADSATNFVVVVDNGTTATTYDTGVAFAADTWFNLELEVSPTNTRGWVNGALVVDVANVPAANTNILVSPLIGVRVGTPTVTRLIYYDLAYIAYKNPNARGAVSTDGPFA